MSTTFLSTELSSFFQIMFISFIELIDTFVNPCCHAVHTHMGDHTTRYLCIDTDTGTRAVQFVSHHRAQVSYFRFYDVLMLLSVFSIVYTVRYLLIGSVYRSETCNVSELQDRTRWQMPVSIFFFTVDLGNS